MEDLVIIEKERVRSNIRSLDTQIEERVKKLLNLIAKNPFQNPPSYEKLVGDLQGYYSRRINLQHRLVYKVYEDINTVVVHSMWSHYGDN